MPAWNAYSFVFGPLIAFGGLGLLILLLRWTFKRGTSVVASPGKPGMPDEYGLLVPISTPANYIEGEIQRRALVDAGIRASLAQTNDGPRLMVWPADADHARTVLTRHP